jgi:hypothetical protein
MAVHADRDDAKNEGVEFIHEDDGSITARDIETGVASFGDTKAEALSMLAEALALHSGEAGEPVTDEDLREIGIDPETVSDDLEPSTAPWFDSDDESDDS